MIRMVSAFRSACYTLRGENCQICDAGDSLVALQTRPSDQFVMGLGYAGRLCERSPAATSSAGNPLTALKRSQKISRISPRNVKAPTVHA